MIPVEMIADTFDRIQRRLVFSSSIIQKQQSTKWKAALWSKDSIEPAMLRVPIVIVVFIMLWGVNIWVLERSSIRSKYLSVLSVKSGAVSHVLILSIFLAGIYSLTMTLFANLLGMTVETGVLLFYIILLLLTLIPKAPGQEVRLSFFRLIKLVFFPLNSITFSEVLLADALTSISKILKDIGITIIAVTSQLSNTNIVNHHEIGMIVVALLASLPFWLRIRQCYVQFVGCTDYWGKVPVTLNLIKYTTAFPPIWLAAAASLGFFHPDLPAITAAMATINSLYSYSWDIIMDWGLLTITRKGRIIPRQRQRMALPIYCYVFAAILNFILRFSWAANRIPQLSNLHSSHLVLLVELAEVTRRSIWNIFRIEWEVACQDERAMANKDGDDIDKN